MQKLGWFWGLGVTHRHTTTAYTALSIASRGKNVSRDVTTPLSGRFVVRRLGLATVNLCTKFEVSTFTRCKDIKCDEKMQILGWFWGLGVTQGHQKHRHRAHMTSNSTLIETMHLSCNVFEL